MKGKKKSVKEKIVEESDRKYIQQNNISNIYGRTIDKPTHICLVSLSVIELTHHDFQCEHNFYTIHTTRVESEIIIHHM